MSKPLSFYVEFNVKPEAVDRFLQGATGVIDAMSKEQTFVTAYLHRDSDNPYRFTLYERWLEPTMDDFINNQLNAKDYRKEYEAYLPGLLTAPRTFEVLDPIGEWHK
jgi:quinol monooxygenase YgiN